MWKCRLNKKRKEIDISEQFLHFSQLETEIIFDENSNGKEMVWRYDSCIHQKKNNFILQIIEISGLMSERSDDSIYPRSSKYGLGLVIVLNYRLKNLLFLKRTSSTPFNEGLFYVFMFRDFGANTIKMNRKILKQGRSKWMQS